MKIKPCLRGIAHDTGYAIASKKGAALIWMSAGNSYFKESIIEELLSFCAQHFSQIFIMAPENPAEHTYRGIGYTETKARRKAQLNANLLMNRAKRAQKKLNKENIFLKDWSDHIEENEKYVQALRYVKKLYVTSSAFHKDVLNTTFNVIEGKIKQHQNKDDAVTEAANYLLEELAFVLVAHHIFGVEELAYIYHRDWEIYRKFVAGEYDNQPKKHLGFVIIT